MKYFKQLGLLLLCFLIGANALELTNSVQRSSRSSKSAKATRYPNIHGLTLRLYSKLYKQLRERRNESSIKTRMFIKCRSANILPVIRNEIINCRVVTSQLPSDSYAVKNIRIGCLVNILEAINEECSSLSSVESFQTINRAIYQLKHLRKANVRRFQIVSKVALRRISHLLRITSSSVKDKLNRIKAVISNKKPKKGLRGSKGRKSRKSKRRQKARRGRKNKKSKKGKKRVPKLPKNSKADIEFLKKTNCNKRKVFILAHIVGRAVNRIMFYS